MSRGGTGHGPRTYSSISGTPLLLESASGSVGGGKVSEVPIPARWAPALRGYCGQGSSTDCSGRGLSVSVSHPSAMAGYRCSRKLLIMRPFAAVSVISLAAVLEVARVCAGDHRRRARPRWGQRRPDEPHGPRRRYRAATEAVVKSSVTALKAARPRSSAWRPMFRNSITRSR